jgi:phospholipid transport system transporter-binding protein
MSRALAEKNRMALESGRLMVHGELAFDSVPGLLEQSRTLLCEGHGPLAIDLAQVERADSAGLALMIEWMRMARRHERDIRFMHLPEQIRAIAEASDLERILPIADDQD